MALDEGTLRSRTPEPYLASPSHVLGAVRFRYWGYVWSLAALLSQDITQEDRVSKSLRLHSVWTRSRAAGRIAVSAVAVPSSSQVSPPLRSPWLHTRHNQNHSIRPSHDVGAASRRPPRLLRHANPGGAIGKADGYATVVCTVYLSIYQRAAKPSHGERSAVETLRWFSTALPERPRAGLPSWSFSSHLVDLTSGHIEQSLSSAIINCSAS